MESTGFENINFNFETGNVTPTLLLLDYTAQKCITYILSHFLGDFSYRIGSKKVKMD